MADHALSRRLRGILALADLKGEFGPGSKVLVTVRDGELAFARG